MKRLWFLAAALLAAMGVAAQEAGDASDGRVLDEARDRYFQSEYPGDPGASDAGSPAEQTEYGDSGRPWAPFVLSFTPGLSFPMEYCDTPLALGLIGSLAGTVHGFQGSGVFSLADDVYGAQVSGVFSMADSVASFQAAGVFVMADTVSGVQLAGVFSMADRVDGGQLAGVFNMADEVNGVMLAGVFNAASRVNGVMIGLVNMADSLNGTAIGLVNLIGDGVSDLALEWLPEADYYHLVWRSGTRNLYTALGLGQSGADLFTPTGLSASFGLGKRISLGCVDVDAELGMELPAEDAYTAWDRFGDHQYDNLPFDRAFGTLKLSAAIGGNGGALSVGIRADFSAPDSDTVPLGLRTGFLGGSAFRLRTPFLDLDVWPKLVLGVRM